MVRNSTTAGDLTWLLQDLVNRVRHVRHAVLLSADGLRVASSEDLPRETAEHVSAIASGLQSLARGVGTSFELDRLRQTVLEFEGGYFFLTAAGHGTCLAVISGPETDMGVVAYEMEVTVQSAAEHLATLPRAHAQTDGG